MSTRFHCILLLCANVPFSETILCALQTIRSTCFASRPFNGTYVVLNRLANLAHSAGARVVGQQTCDRFGSEKYRVLVCCSVQVHPQPPDMVANSSSDTINPSNPHQLSHFGIRTRLQQKDRITARRHDIKMYCRIKTRQTARLTRSAHARTYPHAHSIVDPTPDLDCERLPDRYCDVVVCVCRHSRFNGHEHRECINRNPADYCVYL